VVNKKALLATETFCIAKSFLCPKAKWLPGLPKLPKVMGGTRPPMKSWLPALSKIIF